MLIFLLFTAERTSVRLRLTTGSVSESNLDLVRPFGPGYKEPVTGPACDMALLLVVRVRWNSSYY